MATGGFVAADAELLEEAELADAIAQEHDKTLTGYSK